MGRIGLLFLGSVLVASPVIAQRQPTLLGSRLQVWYGCGADRPSDDSPRDCSRSTGTLLSLDRDTMVLQQGLEHVAVPVGSVRRTMISDGVRGHFLAGAGIGLLAGTAIVFGYLAIVEHLCDPNADDDNFGYDGCLAIGGIAGGLPGLLIGGVIGALIRTDRWRGLDSDRFRIGIAPSEQGIRLQGSIRF